MNSLRTAKRFLFPLLGLWVLLYASFSLLKPPMLDGTDSIQAEAAREMAVHGDWITPHVNGVRWLEVSPLLTWSSATTLKLFGIADWTARLPLAFYALGLFVLTLTLGARLFHTPVAGFYAALVLFTSEGIFLFAHLLYVEILSTLWLALAMYFFWRSLHHEHASRATAAGFAIACALGVLSQGLSGVVLPVVIVLLFLIFTRNLRHLLRWHPVMLVILFLVLVVPWHVAVCRANGLPLHTILLRSGDPSAPVLLGALLLWAFLLLWILPWCFFSVAALVRLPARISARTTGLDPAYQARLLLILWPVVTALFFTFTRREEFAVLPALPALALLAGGWMAADEVSPSPAGRVFAWIFFVAGIVLALAALLIGLRAPSPAPGADIATLLHLHPGQHRLFFGHFTDLTMASMGAFRIPLFIAVAALLAGVTVNLIFRIKHHARMANCFLAGMMAFLLIAAHVALNTFSPVLSAAVLAQAIKPEVKASDVIVVNGRYKDASALSFYLERSVHLLNAPADALGPYSADAPTLFETTDSLATRWAGEGRVFLFTTPQAIPSLPGEVYLIGRNGGREIVSNQPNSGGASF